MGGVSRRGKVTTASVSDDEAVASTPPPRSTRAAASRARAGRWLLAVAVFASGICLGALHTPVLAVCAVIASVATGLLCFDAAPQKPRPAATALVVVAVGLILWTGLQIVPLPRSALAVLAPENADIWSRALTPLREEGPAWVTLSLDPLATRRELLRGLTYLVVFVGALQIARRQDGVTFLERVLVVATATTATAALLHPALGARKIFGLYEPKETLGYYVDHLGPLLNLNHLAAYVNIGLLVAFGAVVTRRDALPRILAVVLVVLLGATTVWSLSRGGTATMLVGLFAVLVVSFWARRTGRSSERSELAIATAAIGGGAVLFLSLFDQTRSKFIQNDLSKLDLIKNVSLLLRPHGVFGVGRGAFESTFPSVRTGTDYFVFTNPENIVLQWTTEWGIPVAVVALASIVWVSRPRTVLARSRPPAGAWGALVAVFLQNLVDFSSEVPGIVVALAVCAAIVTGGMGGAERSAPVRWFGRWSSRPRILAFVLAGLTMVLALVTVPVAHLELYNEERAFRDVGLDRSLTKEAFHARARGAMLRHPAEPYFPFVGAVRATAVKDESLLPWAARALERSPVYGRVHLLLARSLFGTNPSQARLEYRIACMQDVQICLVDESARLVASFEDAMELVPEGPHASAVLARLTALLATRLPSTAVRLDRELATRDPSNLGRVARLGAAALADAQTDAPWCEGAARRSCIDEGLAAAAFVRGVSPEVCEGHVLTAELRIVAGDVNAAFGELERALDRVTDRSPCARRTVSIAQRLGNSARVDAALERLLRLGCESQDECIGNLLFAATVESGRGNGRRAFSLTKKASERAPERDDLLADAASRAEEQGLHGEALDAYMKLGDRHPGEPKWRIAVAREHDAIARGVYQRR